MATDGPLAELRELTRRLRAECPWDREQTARTIVPHTIEEAYEVADAALADDSSKLHDELGDLLFQVYFLSLLLEERHEGDLDSVAESVHAKLVRRHPHVFGEAEALEALQASAADVARSTPTLGVFVAAISEDLEEIPVCAAGREPDVPLRAEACAEVMAAADPWAAAECEAVMEAAEVAAARAAEAGAAR